jgi:hypothetical protein
VPTLVVDWDAGPELVPVVVAEADAWLVVPPSPAGELVELGWAGELGELDGTGVVEVEVGGDAAAGGTADGSGEVPLGWGLPAALELPAGLEDEPFPVALAVGGCVRERVALVPAVDLAALPPLGASRPLRPAVADLPPLVRSPAFRRARSPTDEGSGLCRRTVETACPSSEPESAGRGSGANPIRLAQSAASQPASARPRTTFPSRTAR